MMPPMNIWTQMLLVILHGSEHLLIVGIRGVRSFRRILPGSLQRALGGVDLVSGRSELRGGRVRVLPYGVIEVGRIIAILAIPR